MPTYEYACDACGHEFETFHLMSAEPLKDCPSCSGATLRRKIGLGAGIIFKGGGFYETDFKDRKGTPDKTTKTEDKPAASQKDSGGAAADAAKTTAKTTAEAKPASGAAKAPAATAG